MRNHLFLLVLLSALLTSCGEANNKTAVYLAQQSQTVVLDAYRRGEESRMEIKEITEDKSVPDTQSRAKKLLNATEKIDAFAAKEMQLLERLKADLLRDLGENSASESENDIVTEKWNAKDPLQPAVFNLQKVKYAGTTRFLDHNSENGKKIVSSMREFRRQITTSLAASASYSEKSYFFSDPDIGAYKNAKDLYRQIDRAIAESRVSPDDAGVLKMIYASLTHSNAEWKALLNADCRWETAFQLLTNLQAGVLRARADAIRTIRYRIGCCANYSFNEILVFTPGPEYAAPGEEIDFSVLIAAYDSDRQPVVKTSAGRVVAVRDGMAIVRVKVPESGGAELTLSGTVSVFNKSGIPKTLPWTKKITVGRN